MKNEVSIYHFDDEPEIVEWIPELLRNYYRKRNPSWMRGAPTVVTEADVYRYSFSIDAPKGSVDIRYLLYGNAATEAKFRQLFHPQKDDILILDLYHETRGGLLEAGIAHYQAARGLLAPQRIYILTGYPDRAKPILIDQSLLAENLFSKPPSTGAFIAELARKLQRMVPDA